MPHDPARRRDGRFAEMGRPVAPAGPPEIALTDAPGPDELADTHITNESFSVQLPWKGPHPQRVERPSGMDGTDPESKIRRSIWKYPTVTPNRTEALLQLFITGEVDEHGVVWEYDDDREPRFEDGLYSVDPVAIGERMRWVDDHGEPDPELEAKLDAFLDEVWAERNPGKPKPAPQPLTPDQERSVFDRRVAGEVELAGEFNAEHIAVRVDLDAAAVERPLLTAAQLERFDRHERYRATLAGPLRADWAAARAEFDQLVAESRRAPANN